MHKNLAVVKYVTCAWNFFLGGGFSCKKIHKTYCDKNTNIDMNQTDQYENFS